MEKEGRKQRTFLKKYHASKTIVQVPEVYAAHTTFVVSV